MVFTLSRIKIGRKVSFKSKKRIHITVNSNLNSSETNNSNKSNSDYDIVNSNLSRIKVHTKTSINKQTHYFVKTKYTVKYWYQW